MKFAKALAPVMAASLLATSLLCSCDSGAFRQATEPEIELPKDEILVLNSYKNGFEGYDSIKLFILSDGSVYCSKEQVLRYPLNRNEGLTDEQRIELLKKYTEPVAVIPEKDIREIYGYMVKIDPDAEMDYEDLYVTDIGTEYTEVYVDGKGIRISESGEMTGILDDRNAKKADSLINKSIKSCGAINYPGVYSGYEVFLGTLECSKEANPFDSKRIITNIDELKAFENETGLMLRNIEGFEDFGNPDNDSFEYMCIAVQIFMCPYVEEPYKADGFIVSDDYVGFASFEESNAVIQTYEGRYKFWCHVVQLPYYPVEGTAPYDAFLN